MTIFVEFSNHGLKHIEQVSLINKRIWFNLEYMLIKPSIFTIPNICTKGSSPCKKQVTIFYKVFLLMYSRTSIVICIGII